MRQKILEILFKILSILDYIDFHYCKKERLLDNYKVIDEANVDNIKILTDTGYEDMSCMMMTKPFEIWHIELDNGYRLDCADEHVVFGKDYEEIFVENLKVGDHIQTDDGLHKVINIMHSNDKICMCDTSISHPNHRFYSNGILSHNSVTTAIYCLWVILFNTDKAGLILSKSGPAGVDLMSKIKDMYMYLPYHLKVGTEKWNQTGIAFDNNSSISTEAFSPTAGLGKTINFLILDEFAWCPPNDVELFYNNIIPTVTTISDANVCIMSTQNGFNLFYKIWKGAIEKKNIYAPFKVDWWQVPQYNKDTHMWEKRTEAWKDKMVGILGSEEAFQYQYGTMFSSSDNCLVSRGCLAKLRDNAILWEPRVEDLQNAGFDIFLQHPECLYWDPNFDFNLIRTEAFVVVGDLAEGSGQDYTPFNILWIKGKDDYQHVGRWYSNEIDLEGAALEFWLLVGQLFSSDQCIWSIEWNTYGALFYRILMNLCEPDYGENTLWRFNILPEGIDLSLFAMYKKNSVDDNPIKSSKHTSNYMPGIKFTSGNKPTACTLLKMKFEKQQISTSDLITIGELENFEDKSGNGSYKASYGHDDSIMTFVQIPMLEQTPKFKELIEDIELHNTSKNIDNQWITTVKANQFDTLPSIETQSLYTPFS